MSVPRLKLTARSYWTAPSRGELLGHRYMSSEGLCKYKLTALEHMRDIVQGCRVGPSHGTCDKVMVQQMAVEASGNSQEQRPW